jgi:hypothetical protein
VLASVAVSVPNTTEGSRTAEAIFVVSECGRVDDVVAGRDWLRAAVRLRLTSRHDKTNALEVIFIALTRRKFCDPIDAIFFHGKYISLSTPAAGESYKASINTRCTLGFSLTSRGSQDRFKYDSSKDHS